MAQLLATPKNDDWHLLEFYTPIKEVPTEVKEGMEPEFFIEGVAISETTTHNGHKFIAQELQKATPTLIDKPLLVDHNNSALSIMGRVTGAMFDASAKAVMFRAKVHDKTMQTMIKDGRLRSVSIGAFAKDLVKEEETGSYLAQGIQFVELSLVAVPADENANFAMAMAKNFALKESFSQHVAQAIVSEQKIERRDREMEENKLQEMEAHNKELVEQNKKALEELAMLRNERKTALINEYKKLCTEKKVKEQDVSQLSEDVIKLLTEQVKSVIVEKKELKSTVAASVDTEGLDHYMIERSQKGVSIWAMPDASKYQRNHNAFSLRSK